MRTLGFMLTGVVMMAGVVVLAVSPLMQAAEAPDAREKPAAASPDGARLVPADIKLPKPQFIGTPRILGQNPNLEKYVDKDRPPFLVPEGVTNVALGKPVTSSEPEPIVGELTMVTNNDKEGEDGRQVELGPRKQWVQIDLKEPCQVYGILIWHYHAEARVYHDVIVQAADDPDFIENVRTLCNNDFDNSSGLGLGKDMEYIESHRGRLVDTRGPDGKGIKTRYLRFYSNGNTSNDQSHYTEIEVLGKPAK